MLMRRKKNLSYSIDDFVDLYKRYIHREGADELLEWILSTDAATAPASSRFHGAFPGGWADHAIDVFQELYRLHSIYKDEIPASDETLAIVSLLHDVCKLNFYTVEMRNKKIDGQWQSVPTYAVDEKFSFAGYHGPKSVFLIQHFMELTPEEAVAIAGHMGNEDGKFTVWKSYERMPLAWLVHTADEAATVFEKEENL